MNGLNLAKGASRRSLLNAVSNYIGEFTWLVVWFFLTPFILTSLGEADFGLWALVGAASAYGSLFDLGIADAVTKYVAEYRAKNELAEVSGLIATALSVYTVVGLLVMLGGSGFAPFFAELFNVSGAQKELAAWVMLLGAVNVGVSIPCASVWAVLRGLQRFDLVNVIRTAGTLLQGALTVLAILLGLGVPGLLFAAIVVRLLLQIPAVLAVRRVAPEIRFGWRGAQWSVAGRVASFSWAIFLNNVGGHLETKTDEIVIGASMPVSAIAPYSVCQKLSHFPLIVTEQFLKLLLPLAAELSALGDSRRLRELYVTSSRITVAVFIPIGGALMLLAGPLLGAWLGDVYREYALLVYILVVATFLDTILWPAGFVLQGMSRHKIPAVMTVLTGVANLALSIALVSRFGLRGVALGTLIPTTFVAFGFFLPFSIRVIGVSWAGMLRKVFVPTLVPIAPMVLVTYFIREAWQPASLPAVGVLGGICVLTYAIAYLRFFAGATERAMMRNLRLSVSELFRRQRNLS